MTLNPAQRPAWSQYVIAVLAVALAATARAWLLGALGTRAPFITFYPAVIFTAVYGRFLSGLLATALSALIAAFAWMEPVGHLAVRDSADWLGLAVFVACGAAISWATQAMHRAQERATEAEAQVELATERAWAEEELRHYKLLAEHSRDVILYMRREDGRILEANAAATKAYGYTRAQLQMLSIHQLRASGTSTLTAGQLEEADTSGILFETMHRRQDGSLFPVEVSSQGATINGTRSLISVIRDITGRKQAEAELRASQEAVRESESRYRRLVDLAPEALIVQQDGRIMYCNEAAARLYAAETPDRLIGTAMLDRVHPDDRPIVRDRISEAERGVTLPIREARHLRLDNREVAVETTAGPTDWHGRRAMQVFVRDITARKRAEERIRDAQKMESLGVLAGGVAHDFNNLLLGIIGNASLTREMLPPEHPASELLAAVVKTGEQAALLTRQMLAYAGKGRFIVERINLSTLISDMVGLVRPSISKRTTLHLELEADLPPIEADRGQVQQVFMNLALNAAEAIGNHDGVITVATGVQDVDDRYAALNSETTALAPGKYVRLELRDTGCGMDDATKAKIFDPFFSTKFVGRGLGLAAVAGIVRSHRGSITVVTAPGQGSCFSVLFPASTREPDVAPLPPAEGQLHGSGTVLVVDEEAAVRTFMVQVLTRYGYEALAAESGMAAVDILKRHPGEIAAVILDLSAPGVSGDDTLPEIRRIRPQTKVLISSGYSEAELMELFQGQRIAGFIQKPHAPNLLMEKLKNCLGG